MDNKICQNCKAEFTIEPADFLFYEKIKVSPPTWCPECRLVRRICFRNERTLYYGVCGLCGKKEITIYNPKSNFTIYCHDCFYCDKWSQLDYGMDYDFSKSFLEQFRELQNRMPKLSKQQSKSMINSEYTNHSGDDKNCYLAFASVNDEDCYYANYVSYSKNIFDGLRIFKSEQCYECVDCLNCQNLRYSEKCSNSFDGSFLYNCKSCSNCFLCSNLVSQSYCILNKKYTKEEYREAMKNFNLGSHKAIVGFKRQFEILKRSSIRRSIEGFNNINSTGSYLTNTKNCQICFDVADAEDSKYIGYGNSVKDSMDVYAAYPKTELCYESAATGAPSYRCMFSYLPWACSDIIYSICLFSNCQNCFGCNQLTNKSYCILNKQYSKEEYEVLVPKIIKHMNEMPFVDNRGRIYKYGEFFPPEFSPFPYNDTIAQQYFPATKEEALKFGSRWYEEEEKNYQITKMSKELPDDIKDLLDSVLSEIIGCEHEGKCKEQCTNAFKITENELIFYRKMNIPLPTLCPNCRHYERLKKRNPMKLWHRTCMCDKESHEHTGKCKTEFETSYSQERPEIIFCEKCYQKEVY